MKFEFEMMFDEYIELLLIQTGRRMSPSTTSARRIPQWVTILSLTVCAVAAVVIPVLLFAPKGWAKDLDLWPAVARFEWLTPWGLLGFMLGIPLAYSRGRSALRLTVFAGALLTALAAVLTLRANQVAGGYSSLQSFGIVRAWPWVACGYILFSYCLIAWPGRAYARQFSKSWFGTKRFVVAIENEGMRDATDVFDVYFRWTGIERAVATEKLLCVFDRCGTVVFAVPTRAIGDALEVRRVEQIISDYIKPREGFDVVLNAPPAEHQAE